MPESSKSNWTGKTLGKYRLTEPLGRGGMAEVFKAFQANLDRYVAVKVIHPHLVEEDPAFITRFEAEAKSVAGLRHPNIVQVYDFDAEGDTPYMVMELIAGMSLKRYLDEQAQRRALLPFAEIIRLARDIGDALAYAHAAGLVHRDVKPANVMLDTSGLRPRPILTDFGLAKLIAAHSRTATGLVGTPAYMAPEQGMGRAVDHRADLYALGVMLYEMVTGHLPFEGDTAISIILKHISEPLPAPRALNPNVPEPLEQVVIRCLAKEPDDRYASAADLITALDSASLSFDSQLAPPLAVPSPEALTRDGDLTPLVAPSTVLAVGDETGLLTPPTRSPMATVPHVDAPPPPEPVVPPALTGFVGREMELAVYANQLALRHLAVLTGMTGVGKTRTAAALAARVAQAEQVFWHTFHAGEDVNVLIWKLAGFLYWRRHPDVWQTLQAAQQTGNPLPPPEVLFDYLFQRLRGQNYLLVLDDVQRVDDDPLLAQFAERLQAATEAGAISVILAAQRLPTFLSGEGVEPLGGLNRADALAVIQQRGLTVSEPVAEAVWARTGGNAQLLTLACDALRKSKDSARLMERLSESEHIERFLMNEVDKGLSADERTVLSAVAALLGEPGTRAALEAGLDGMSVRRTLNELSGRHLLQSIEGEDGKEYSLPALVGDFYYDALSKRDRQATHARLAAFYESEEPHPLRAARQWHAAGETTKAAQLITADMWALLNQGQAHGARQLLEQFTERGLSAEQWARLLLTRGQVYAVLGEDALARQSYWAAYTQAALKAEACLGLGELLQTEAPTDALEWLRRGLNEIREQREHPSIVPLRGSAQDALPVEAALHIRIGRILAYQSQWDEAEAELQTGLSLLPPGPSRLRLSALGNLGNIASTRGEVQTGRTYYEQVAEAAEVLHDGWALGEVWINLGIEMDGAGEWADAQRYYIQALEQSERLGSASQTVRAELGLGNLAVKQGDADSAEQYLTRALALARQKGWQAEQVYASISLAGAYLRRAQPEAARAETLLAEAEQLAEAADAREPLPELYTHRATLKLLQNQNEQAWAEAEKALALAREQQSKVYEGMALRVLAQAQQAAGKHDAARANLRQSLALLTDVDAYEAALTADALKRIEN